MIKFKGHECVVEMLKYPNGRPAIRLNIIKNGEPFRTVSVNLPDQDLIQDGVFIKDWNGNEGIVEILEDAGVIKLTGMQVRSGCCFAKEAKIL